MALQVVYKLEIQKRLDLFRQAWNNHRIRLANNLTPTQIWTEGVLTNSERESTALNNIFGDDPYSQENLEAGLARHGIQLTQLQANTEELEQARIVSQPLNNLIEAAESRVSELEVEVSGPSDSFAAMEADVSGMKKELATLKDRCENLEVRSRPCNVRITGVKEGREHGKHPSWFVADMLKEALNLEKPPTIDRAHRSLRSNPTQDNIPPRAFVMKCHYFSEKESLLKKAIEMKSVTTADGNHIRILPDFTQTVSKQRAAFTEVRGLLWGCEGVRYSLRYPATLSITTTDGQEASFKDPKLAKEFVLKRVMHEAS
uniref:Integrase core domain-containing protein n=1 Tax=Seriola dumerili TaxID=41447 RepID=A0A3B4UUN6_SERDU